MTWSAAENHCRARGADLPQLTSIEENNFLKRSGKSWWLDLRRDSTHKTMFKLSDGSLPIFTNWALSEPNNVNEGCGEQYGSGEWNDILCSATRQVACEKGTCVVYSS